MNSGPNTGPTMPAWLRRLVDHRREGALVTGLRRRRFQLFRELIDPLPRPVRILDLGGEPVFWTLMGLGGDPDYAITVLNLYPAESGLPNMKTAVGDATDLHGVPDRSYDAVFSNSVIEHLPGLEQQRCMANEVRRVGRRYFVQTPNRWFPIEPHFLFPGYQFLPFGLQVALIRRFNLGWYARVPDERAAREHVRAHRLLAEGELRDLFPGARIYKERILGLTKSLIACGGEEEPDQPGGKEGS